jgi:hypothetical protein
MRDWTGVVHEHRVSASPVWLRLTDTFTSKAPLGPVDVRLERRDGARWVPVRFPYQLKPNGDLAFLDLGRGQLGEAGATFDIRVSVSAPRTLAETAAGDEAVMTTITVWTDDALPPPATLQAVSFYPGPDYQFGPGVPVLAGRVVDAAGDGVRRARVTATETVLGTAITEEVRSGDGGWFRLPLRWSKGGTQIDADKAGAAGSITVNLPGDLGSVQLITLS